MGTFHHGSSQAGPTLEIQQLCAWWAAVGLDKAEYSLGEGAILHRHLESLE